MDERSAENLLGCFVQLGQTGFRRAWLKMLREDRPPADRSLYRRNKNTVQVCYHYIYPGASFTRWKRWSRRLPSAPANFQAHLRDSLPPTGNHSRRPADWRNRIRDQHLKVFALPAVIAGPIKCKFHLPTFGKVLCGQICHVKPQMGIRHLRILCR
jgi:hypothetical protein